MEGSSLITTSSFIIFSTYLTDVAGMSCGIDKSPVSHVYEGEARIETYPWLGLLFYPYSFNKRVTTAVVLVTRQIVLATATEIDRLPKDDFRARARVVIGHNCTGPDIGIRDYSYHPDYTRRTYSALAMIQLETDHINLELRPICPPPAQFMEKNVFYAMVLSNDCRNSQVRIHRMKYVSPDQCKEYYRRTGLDVNTMWPSHTACARSLKGGRCVWRSGAILVVKVGRRWRLLGFGVYGPGCQAPARFLDYGMYHPWVQRSLDRIGRPAITTMGSNHVILRRTLSSVQRFGPCDREETKFELYTDQTNIDYKRTGFARYNLTIMRNVEYSCIVFKAEHESEHTRSQPIIRLRRWCVEPTLVCDGFGYVEIQFFVEIKFTQGVYFQVLAYGMEAKIIDPAKAMRLLNENSYLVTIPSYNETKEKYHPLLTDRSYVLYNKE